MRADNSRHIAAAARNRHEYTRAKAIKALREIDTAGTTVTFDIVARAAGVSRSWLYTQPDLRTEIERLRLMFSVPRSTVYGHLDRAKTVPRQPKKTKVTKP